MPKPTDFLLNTDYEMDKIVLYKTGTINAGQYDVQINHNLPFVPLVFGIFSYNEDFSDSYSMPYSYVTRDNTINVNLTANNSTVFLSYINYSGSPAKIYYRVFAFEPSDSRAKVGATSKYAKQFILNTDYNYCKLKEKGVVDALSPVTIKHDLGYIPQVLVWNESAGSAFPVQTSTPYSSGAPQARVTKDALYIYNMERGHYRIYYDEA